jgi:hypothetical protein
MKNWLHLLGTIGVAAATVLTPSLQGVIAAHPLVAGGLMTAWTVIGNILQSPVQQSK